MYKLIFKIIKENDKENTTTEEDVSIILKERLFMGDIFKVNNEIQTKVNTIYYDFRDDTYYFHGDFVYIYE